MTRGPDDAAAAPPAVPSGVVAVVGGGATNVKSTVALNLAVALAGLGAVGAPALALVDLDGAPRRALRLDGAGAAALPWAAAPLPVRTTLDDARAKDAPDRRLLVVDPPPRFDPATEAVLAAADLVVVPVDASAIALRVLGEVARRLGDTGASLRLRVVLARRLPRAVDRWGLLDRIEEWAPGGALAATLPMARPRGADPRAAVLYAPGTAAARAYAVLAAEVVDALAARSSLHRERRISTTP